MGKVIKTIDVVVPCYNVGHTIKNCIDSLRNQSFPRESYHCFLINDASTDKTKSILEEYRLKDNITVIHHENNLGLSATRNTGIKAGVSELIAFLDGDMVANENWLESFLPYFDSNVVAVMGDNIPPENIILNPVEKYYFGELRGARKYSDGELIPLQFMLYNNTMVKREVLKKSKLFNESIYKYGGEDTDLSARIWDLYPNSFIFSKKSNVYHFHRRNLTEFCRDMEVYGSHNLPFLLNQYPHHKTKFGFEWIFSFKGYLVFNLIIRNIIKFLLKIYPAQILIRYIVVYSVLSGARKSKKRV